MSVIRVHRHLLVGLAQIKALPEPRLLRRPGMPCCQALRNAEGQTCNVVDILELQVGRHRVRLIQLRLVTIVNWPQLHLGTLNQHKAPDDAPVFSAKVG